MNINGLVVDTDNIGRGLYQMICDKGEDAVVAHGMIPAWCIESFERLLREKIVAVASAKAGCQPAELEPHVDKPLVAKMVRDISHEVVVAIYKEAERQGRMLV